MGAGLLAGEAAAATVKASQKAAGYQDTPKGRAHCDVCTQWVAPSSCKVVEGEIKPLGWCQLFVAKA